jgi:ferredoxin
VLGVPKLTILPQNQVIELEAGTSVFHAARGLGIDVDTACGGKGTCGLCRVKIISGGDQLPPASWEEKKFIGTAGNLRLSCRIAPTADVTVDIPPPRPKKKKPGPPPPPARPT